MIKSLGIIGCGAVTQKQYIKVLGMFHADVSVDYVFDINSGLADSVAQRLGAQAVTKEHLLSESDIVIIATPPSTHGMLIKEALKPGNKVICEKPFVGSIKEYNELAELAKERQSELYVAHFRRTYPSVQLARSVIKSKILGDVTSMEAYEGGKFSWITTSGYVYNDPFGGVLFDTGSHTIDMALYIANIDTIDMQVEVLSIVKDKKEPAHDVTATLKLKTFANNINFKVKLSRKLLLANKIRITCTNGFIDVPVALANNIRIGGSASSTVVYSNANYDTLMDAFAMQFKEMFYEVNDSAYKVSKFINLTKILEVIANN